MINAMCFAAGCVVGYVLMLAIAALFLVAGCRAYGRDSRQNDGDC